MFHVLQLMVETKLIRDCRTIGSTTTRGFSCIVSAMIIIDRHLSEKGGNGGESW